MNAKKAPSPFSKANPRLQLAWDATSLGALMFCPTYYKLNILDGWEDSVRIHLDFGLAVHSALEAGDRVIAAQGIEHWEAAQAESLREALELSWEDTPDGGRRPRMGAYMRVWRCTHNPGPGKRKCEYAKANRWFHSEPPGICGECESPIQVEDRWIDHDKGRQKTRLNLLRAAVWYWQQFEGTVVPMRPIVFPNKDVAVEFPFRLPTCVKTNTTGEEYILCGYLDGLVGAGVECFTRERKTTKSGLGKHFFSGFLPNPQTDLYDIIPPLLFPEKNFRGVLLEGTQTLVSGVQFAGQILYRSQESREEYLKDILEYWLPQAEQFAVKGHWPMNRRSCKMCSFKEICSKPPKSRERFLAANFERREERWNPLKER